MHAMAFMALAAMLALPAVAGADPGKAGSGNPHQEGASGNPHQDGASGNPHQQGGNPGAAKGRSTAPGQVKRETHATPRAQPRGGPKAKSEATGNAKGKAHAKGKADVKGQKGGRSDRPAPKTTLCHATGSETNPFVEITISDNALDAHRRHQNEEDVIPGSIGNCEQSPAGSNPPDDGKNGVTPPPGPQAPGLQPASEVVGQTPAATTPAEAPAPPAAAPGETRVLGVTDESGAEAQPVSDDGDVAGAQQVAGAQDDGGALPFTGLRLAMLALIALASLLAGLGLRRAARPQM
jgi:hypothetical protein